MGKRGKRRIGVTLLAGVIGAVLGTAATMSAASAGRFADNVEVAAPTSTVVESSVNPTSPVGALPIPNSVAPTSVPVGLVPASSIPAPTSAASKPAAKTPSVQLGEGVTITNPAKVVGSGAALDRGMQALALINFDWQSAYPGWTIAFLPAKDGLLGLTRVPERRVEIFVRQSRPVAGIAHDLAHELGHVTDVVYGSGQTRETYRSIRQLPTNTPWWTCNSCRDMQVGAGDFAETFALLVAPKYRFYSEVAPIPSAQELAEIVQFVLPQGLLDSEPPAAGLLSKQSAKRQTGPNSLANSTQKVRR